MDLWADHQCMEKMQLDTMNRPRDAYRTANQVAPPKEKNTCLPCACSSFWTKSVWSWLEALWNMHPVVGEIIPPNRKNSRCLDLGQEKGDYLKRNERCQEGWGGMRSREVRPGGGGVSGNCRSGCCHCHELQRVQCHTLPFRVTPGENPLIMHWETKAKALGCRPASRNKQLEQGQVAEACSCEGRGHLDAELGPWVHCWDAPALDTHH